MPALWFFKQIMSRKSACWRAIFRGLTNCNELHIIFQWVHIRRDLSIGPLGQLLAAGGLCSGAREKSSNQVTVTQKTEGYYQFWAQGTYSSSSSLKSISSIRPDPCNNKKKFSIPSQQKFVSRNEIQADLMGWNGYLSIVNLAQVTGSLEVYQLQRA
jgi:hypothetical protein